MATAPSAPQISQFTQAVIAGSGLDLKDMQRNAMSKQYNVKMVLEIQETNGPKKFFDGGIDYTGVPYTFIVAVEAAMTEMLGKLVQLGTEIATGGEAPPA